jgi:hypothetical protein
VEIVEVSSHLPGWLVVGRDLPALQSGHLLRQGGLLDASGHPELLLYALALYLCEALLLQVCEGACTLPLLGYLAPLYAVDVDNLPRGPSTGRCETLVLPPIVDATSHPACHHLIVFGDLILDDVADVGEGGLFLGNYPQVALAVVRFLVSGMMIDKVGAIISLTASRSPLACASKKRRTSTLFVS